MRLLGKSGSSKGRRRTFTTRFHLAYFETSHQLLEFVRLRIHCFRCRGQLFGGGGVVLSDLIDLSHGAIDLGYASRLFS